MPKSQENLVDLQDIFIGREQQLQLFELYLHRWKSLMRQSLPGSLVLTAPSLQAKIQGLVILIYGDGGLGKSSLLDRYYRIASQAEQRLTTIMVDWEFAIGGNQRILKILSEQYIDIYEYFNVLCLQLAIALGGKRLEEFSEYQKAVRDVQEAKTKADSVLEGLQKDDRFSDLRKMTVDGVVKLLRAIDPTPATAWLDTDVAKQGLNKGLEIGSDQVQAFLAKLRTSLGQQMSALFDPAATLGLSLGRDLAQFARNRPLLIFFDTYEEIDEGDSLLRTVMGAAGIRVGWVLAGRDNLWAGQEQRQRSMEMEYGYKDLVPSDRGLGMDLNSESIGPFTQGEIKEYFDQLCKRTQEPVLLPFITETNAAQVLKLTQGVPLAVKIAAGLYQETADIQLIIEQAEAEDNVIDIMIKRYLLHTKTEPDDKVKLYGLAMLRRAYETDSVVAALGLSPEQAKTQYLAELSRLHRRYSFIFTAKKTPSLHQEVRHFLRLWLRAQRTVPEIKAINERLQEIQKQALKNLEEKRQYKGLKECVQDEEWLGLYLDLIEQTFWLDAFEGIRYLLPLMIAVGSYGSLHTFDWLDVTSVSKLTEKRDTIEDILILGQFFEPVMNATSRQWWQWAAQSKNAIFAKGHERAVALEKLAEGAGQSRWTWFSSLPDCTLEVEALLWWQIGELYRFIDEKRATQWYEKALTRLENEEALKQTLAETYLAIARASYREKHYAQMIQPLDRAIKIQPTYKMLLYERGIAYSWLRRFDEALEDLNRALELDPLDARAYRERGNVYSWLRRFDEALEDLNRALELDPLDAPSYRKRGSVYSQLRRYDEALEDLNRALELDPLDAFSYRERGIILLGLNKKEQASSDFNHASELYPGDIEPLWIHCWAHMSKHKKDEKTIKHLEELVEKSSSFKYVTDRDIEYVCQGVAIGLQGNLEAGLDMLAKITSQQPFLVFSTSFWKGMFTASHSKDLAMAMKMIQEAIDCGMPPILLTPLYWLEKERPEFFETYAFPLLKAYHL